MKRFILTAIALLPVLAAGCLPNATWLPDSSGVVYTGGPHKDTLYLYDLEKKAPRVLVEKGAGPAWPAVSPDGKRIAVVLRRLEPPCFLELIADVRLEIIVFDRDGKELDHSRKVPWAKDHDISAAQVFWVPGRDRLLISSDNVTGVYDLDTGAVKKRVQTVLPFGNSPITPDSKGYLAVCGRRDQYIAVVGWDGAERKIKSEQLAGTEDDEVKMAAGGMLFCPYIHASRWEGTRAVADWKNFGLRIDVDKGEATVDRLKPTFAMDKKPVAAEFRLAGGGIVRAAELSVRTYNSPDLLGSYRVEVLKAGSDLPKTLMDGATLFTVFPSPDGKHALVRCTASTDALSDDKAKPGQDMLFLIDAAGGVADKIDLAK